MPDPARNRRRRGHSTRERILTAAVAVFGEKGFEAASTREIARAAGFEQGLLTYHFPTKDALWRAAAERVFETISAGLEAQLAADASAEPVAEAREMIRTYVRTMAAHPEFFRFIADQGHRFDARTRWLVDRQIAPRFEALRARGIFAAAGVADDEIPHAFFALLGAASFIFAVPANCRRLTGLDPRKGDAIEAHADFVARLVLPEGRSGAKQGRARVRTAGE